MTPDPRTDSLAPGKTVQLGSFSWVCVIIFLALAVAVKVMSSNLSVGDFVKIVAIGFGKVLDFVFGH